MDIRVALQLLQVCGVDLSVADAILSFTLGLVWSCRAGDVVAPERFRCCLLVKGTRLGCMHNHLTSASMLCVYCAVCLCLSSSVACCRQTTRGGWLAIVFTRRLYELCRHARWLVWSCLCRSAPLSRRYVRRVSTHCSNMVVVVIVEEEVVVVVGVVVPRARVLSLCLVSQLHRSWYRQ